MNPLGTQLVYVPDGYNLAWSTPVPGLSIPLAPVTLLFGPVVTWNVVALLAPALSAWTAFLLCRHLTGADLALWPGATSSVSRPTCWPSWRAPPSSRRWLSFH